MRLYANRHSTVSALQKLDVNLNTISELVGWEKPTDATMLATYGHFENKAGLNHAITELGKFIMLKPKMN